MLIEEWVLLPQEMLHQLVLSMRRRCEATIAHVPKLASSISSEIGKKISAETVRRVLHNAGFHGRTPVRKSLINCGIQEGDLIDSIVRCSRFSFPFRPPDGGTILYYLELS
ncbi:hypothetical protein TNCV_1712181 [Trichonephila clavipes]|nr:hypothetical protein TNCV_1712181 [Trichonephila clavipes]